MKLFMCFGGAAAAVIDDEAAVVAARHLQEGQRRRRGRRSLSFRGKSFLSGNKGGNGNEKKQPSSVAPPLAESKKRGVMDAYDDDVVYGVSRASSVASFSALLSSASSMDSDTSSSSSSSASSRSSTASSSPSVSGVLYPQPVKSRPASSSPAAGAAAVVLCLLMVVFCGRVGATLLMSMALYLFPRRWPSRTTRKAKSGAVDALECDATASSASEAQEEETAPRRRGWWLRRGPR